MPGTGVWQVVAVGRRCDRGHPPQSACLLDPQRLPRKVIPMVSSQTLSLAHRRAAAAWAADCAWRVLPLIEAETSDERIRDAIERAYAFSRSELGAAGQIQCRVDAVRAASSASSPAGRLQPGLQRRQQRWRIWVPMLSVLPPMRPRRPVLRCRPTPRRSMMRCAGIRAADDRRAWSGHLHHPGPRRRPVMGIRPERSRRVRRAVRRAHRAAG